MSRLLLVFTLFTITAGNLVHAQQNSYPDYHPPLGIPLVLSANFGELRPNHFHMGVDFKTNGAIGYKLYAIADGYVSRIKVSPYGYGKVLYLNHPDGTTSVYAHCSEFKGSIDSLVRAIQYQTEQFAIEIFPSPDDLPVKKGEIIALSGNSGSSTAPHLHFEIRDTKSEDALNPLVVGFDVADHQAPEIRRMKVVAVNKDGYMINGKSQEYAIRKLSSGYAISGDTITIPGDFLSKTGGIGLIFDVIDRLDGASNQCGLYGTKLVVDGTPLFGQQTDRVSFDDTRYINSHRDLTGMSHKYHKSYRTIDNPLEIYTIDGLGILKSAPGKKHLVELTAYDPKGNTSTLRFYLKIGSQRVSDDFNPKAPAYLLPAVSLSDPHENWSVEVPENAVYEPARLTSGSSPHFCGAEVPIQNPITVRIRLENPTQDPSRYYIAAQLASGKKKALATRYINGWLEASSPYAGTYSVEMDNTPPSIRALSYNSSYIVQGDVLRFHVSEQHTDLEDYDLYIDSSWVLMEYEPKGDILSASIPAGTKGKHDIKVVLTDGCGNQLVYERTLDFR